MGRWMSTGWEAEPSELRAPGRHWETARDKLAWDRTLVNTVLEEHTIRRKEPSKETRSGQSKRVKTRRGCSRKSHEDNS